MGARPVFGVLGPLEVWLDGALVRVGGPRQRALLGLLLCHANRVVSRDQLIEELLGDQPAATADRMLRVQVSRLRKALGDVNGDGQPRLQARPPGYLLHVADGELDLHVFEQQVAAGRQALADGNPGRAAGLLREAESLWRGRPLADLESEPFAGLEARRIETLRVQAVEDRIDTELALGRHAIVCPELEQLVTEHPMRERLRGQLMIALYRCGRQADALQTYQEGRSLLVEELAVEPGPPLRKLQLAVLEQDPALDLPPPAARQDAREAMSPADVVRDVAPDLAAIVAADQSGVATDPPAASRPGPGTMPRPRPRRRIRRITLALGMTAALAALVLVPLSRHGTAQTPLNGNLVALVSASDGAVQATVPLRAPAGLAAGAGSVWVAEPGAGLVARIDPVRRAVEATIPVGTRPTRVVAAGGQVWVLDQSDRTLARIDPQTDTVAQTIAPAGQPSDILLSAGSLWVASGDNGRVLRIDPGTGRTRSVVRVGGNPSGLAAAGGGVWVATGGSGLLARIDARTSQVTSRIRVSDAPAAVVAGASGLWVLSPLDATVSRVDPQRRAAMATVALGGQPAALAESSGSIWIGDRTDGTLLRLAPGNDVVTRFGLGGRISALAAARGGLWVATDTAGASHRGGTLTTIDGPVTTIDPAAATAEDLPPTRVSGLTNDGLITLNHVAGPQGSRLVPDLALALPAPTDGGRTYTFRLRPGIRYSTGALVRPSDVTHSFERLFQLGGAGAPYYQAISGAAACRKAPAGCDLSRGIVADDHAGTVTFHLTQPDPDFLPKLTLAFADVLPATVPGRQARAPLPATGPYMVSRYIPGRELLMVRNPRFREWSAAAQPAGDPDRILIRLGLGGARAAAAVAGGRSDFLPSIGQFPSGAAYFRHYRSQLRINPQLITAFLFLNVNAPPFTDLRVRQAVNLALDRDRVVAGWGGPLAARPACQILPPGLAGYRRNCPWTRDPAADGRWHAPDLPRARRLVAASGTAGMKVTVWDVSPSPQGAIQEAAETVRALRQLGYRASLRLLPPSTYFAVTGDSRNHAQVIDGGWSADYASADDFIGKLTCAYFVPGDSVATDDASGFCDPGLDRQIARTAAGQTSNPAAAATQWARLDRHLTDLAIWLPTVTPNEIDFLSSRVRNYQYNPVWGALIDQLWVR